MPLGYISGVVVLSPSPNRGTCRTQKLGVREFRGLRSKRSYKRIRLLLWPWLHMFTNNQRQEERTGKYGTPRLQYMQDLVNKFQNATDEETKERLVANLANFAYDPFNYLFLRQLNVLELFLDCITEPNEKLVEFGVGGICNACADPANAVLVSQSGGIPLIILCLSSPVKNTVNYAIGALYYLCIESNRDEILKPEVIDALRRYAAADTLSFKNLATAILDKHLRTNKQDVAG